MSDCDCGCCCEYVAIFRCEQLAATPAQTWTLWNNGGPLPQPTCNGDYGPYITEIIPVSDWQQSQSDGRTAGGSFDLRGMVGGLEITISGPITLSLLDDTINVSWTSSALTAGDASVSGVAPSGNKLCVMSYGEMTDDGYEILVTAMREPFRYSTMTDQLATSKKWYRDQIPDYIAGGVSLDTFLFYRNGEHIGTIEKHWHEWYAPELVAAKTFVLKATYSNDGSGTSWTKAVLDRTDELSVVGQGTPESPYAVTIENDAVGIINEPEEDGAGTLRNFVPRMRLTVPTPCTMYVKVTSGAPSWSATWRDFYWTKAYPYGGDTVVFNEWQDSLAGVSGPAAPFQGATGNYIPFYDPLTKATTYRILPADVNIYYSPGYSIGGSPLSPGRSNSLPNERGELILGFSAPNSQAGGTGPHSLEIWFDLPNDSYVNADEFAEIIQEDGAYTVEGRSTGAFPTAIFPGGVRTGELVTFGSFAIDRDPDAVWVQQYNDSYVGESPAIWRFPAGAVCALSAYDIFPNQRGPDVLSRVGTQYDEAETTPRTTVITYAGSFDWSEGTVTLLPPFTTEYQVWEDPGVGHRGAKATIGANRERVAGTNIFWRPVKELEVTFDRPVVGVTKSMFSVTGQTVDGDQEIDDFAFVQESRWRYRLVLADDSQPWNSHWKCVFTPDSTIKIPVDPTDLTKGWDEEGTTRLVSRFAWALVKDPSRQWRPTDTDLDLGRYGGGFGSSYSAAATAIVSEPEIDDDTGEVKAPKTRISTPSNSPLPRSVGLFTPVISDEGYRPQLPPRPWERSGPDNCAPHVPRSIAHYSIWPCLPRTFSECAAPMSIEPHSSAVYGAGNIKRMRLVWHGFRDRFVDGVLMEGSYNATTVVVDYAAFSPSGVKARSNWYYRRTGYGSETTYGSALPSENVTFSAWSTKPVQIFRRDFVNCPGLMTSLPTALVCYLVISSYEDSISQSHTAVLTYAQECQLMAGEPVEIIRGAGRNTMGFGNGFGSDPPDYRWKITLTATEFEED